MAGVCEGGKEPPGSLKAIHEGRPPKENREVELKLRRIQSGIGTQIRCGLVDKASARKGENPGLNPDARENFFRFYPFFTI
ncbi:hypothetical protein ANN_18218 [Periplaneta americana]|uniref:Uncharacterized protein n=1 Tax=Periplaneta americana TaxID=6978 RepID=A0ABQ8SPI0_PERAM|nr:hypothetical protein ANN_18218 [Periplaneta americana]